MEINSTLFIQAINICVCYHILKVFVFKPVIAALASRDQVYREHHMKILDYKKAIEQKERYKGEHAQQFVAFVEKNYPVSEVKEATQVRVVERLDIPVVSQERVRELAQRGAEQIVGKVEHVRN